MIAVVRNHFNGMWVQVRVNVPEPVILYWNSICEQDPEAQ